MASVVLTGDTSGQVTLSAPAVAGTNTITLPAATGTPELLGVGTAWTYTSGSPTSVDFTVIPSWAKRITVMLSGVSTTAANDFIIQLGTGGTPTYATTGYSSGSASTTGTSGASTTAGLMIFNPSATESYYGQIVLTLVDAATFKWVESHALSRTGNQQAIAGGGGVTLSAALTAVRITTIAGTATFDAGSINILYEG